MAIAIQSEWAIGRQQTPTSREAGGVVAQRFEATIDANMDVGDIVELAVLPAYHTVVDAILDTDALGAGVNVDVGVMSGAVGNKDGTRTCGNELFSAQAASAAAVVRASKSSAFTIAPAGADRSIGVKVSAAVTAGSKKIALTLLMVQ
jgi:hypothetical protein